MDHLREGIGLRGYGQKDPKMEYKKEGYERFKAMLDRIKVDVAAKLMRVEIESADQIDALRPEEQEMHMSRGSIERSGGEGGAEGTGEGGADDPKQVTVAREGPKVGRNDPCPCGSGKKYKKCHLLKGVSFDAVKPVGEQPTAE